MQWLPGARWQTSFIWNSWKCSHFRNRPAELNSLLQPVEGSFVSVAHLWRLQYYFLKPKTVWNLPFPYFYSTLPSPLPARPHTPALTLVLLLVLWRALVTPSFHYNSRKRDPLSVYTYNTCTRAGVAPPSPPTCLKTQEEKEGVMLCRSSPSCSRVHVFP